MTAVLLTGATTPLGVGLARALARDSDVTHVVAVGIEPVGNTPFGKDTDTFTYVRTDLTRERNIRELLFGIVKERGISAVGHLALHRSLRALGAPAHQLNVEATRHLLRLCERHPTVRRFVYQSTAEVYRHDHLHPTLLGEDQPLDLSQEAPQRVRDRIEADLTVGTRMGMSPLSICVLRLAEVFAPHAGSQLYEWLRTDRGVCFRPLGFNPMVNVLSVADAVRALHAALKSDAPGVFNIPGKDTLPLKTLAARAGCRALPLPGPALSPLYRVKNRLAGTEFSYAMNAGRFHTSDLLDGQRAREVLGYTPETAVDFADPA